MGYVNIDLILDELQQVINNPHLSIDYRYALHLCQNTIMDFPVEDMAINWHPNDEGAPPKDGTYLVTIVKDGIPLVVMGRYIKGDWLFGIKPIAWAPAPKPYNI